MKSVYANCSFEGASHLLENTRIPNIHSETVLAQAGVRRGHTLLGLYQGVPLTRRGSHYGLVPPDVITIFQRPIESVCGDEREVVTEVRRIVQHEIAHHFGIGDARLQQLERGEG